MKRLSLLRLIDWKINGLAMEITCTPLMVASGSLTLIVIEMAALQLFCILSIRLAGLSSLGLLHIAID